MGDEWPIARPLLIATGRVARAIACPSPGGDGCPRRVIHHADGTLRAVCGDQPAACEAVDLTADDIAFLVLDRKKLGIAVARILDAEPSSELHGAIVGTHRLAAGVGIPVVLAIPGPFQMGMDQLPKMKGRSAIIIPTSGSISSTLTAELAAAGHVIFALGEIVGVDAHQHLTGLQPAATLLAPLRTQLMAEQALVSLERLWVLPSEARWEDLTFDFTDSEVVLVRYRGQTRRFEPDQFGFKNRNTGKPTRAWKLLVKMANNVGRLPRPQQFQTKVEKQKQLMSRRLIDLFGIADDPLPWNSEEQAYVARFSLRDGRPLSIKGGC